MFCDLWSDFKIIFSHSKAIWVPTESGALWKDRNVGGKTTICNIKNISRLERMLETKNIKIRHH